jgi:hypothetical protein
MGPGTHSLEAGKVEDTFCLGIKNGYIGIVLKHPQSMLFFP